MVAVLVAVPEVPAVVVVVANEDGIFFGIKGSLSVGPSSFSLTVSGQCRLGIKLTHHGISKLC